MSPIEEVIINKKSNINPIWIMRQAGRYLPEFREIRKQNPDFIKLCLDENLSSIISSNANVVSALEIIEHLLSPYVLLKKIKAQTLIASVPLKLWFSNAYRSKTDPRDRHYHEFEEWQFNWLLEKTGWKIIAKEKWTNPSRKIGFRPILRNFYPRYYIIYAKKMN